MKINKRVCIIFLSILKLEDTTPVNKNDYQYTKSNYQTIKTLNNFACHHLENVTVKKI